jgi:hypothetical protein
MGFILNQPNRRWKKEEIENGIDEPGAEILLNESEDLTVPQRETVVSRDSNPPIDLGEFETIDAATDMMKT